MLLQQADFRLEHFLVDFQRGVGRLDRNLQSIDYGSGIDRRSHDVKRSPGGLAVHHG